MTKTKKKKTPLGIIMDILEWILIVFVVLIAAVEVISISTKKNNHDVPSFFGHSVSLVLTDSMAYDEEGKEIYPVGTGIFTSKPVFSSLEVGNDIFFYGYYSSAVYANKYALVTVHRIIAKGTDAETGKDFYISQGTNTSSEYGHPGMKNQVQIIFEEENSSSYFTSIRDNHASSTYTLNGTDYEVNAVGSYMGKVIGSSKFIGKFYTVMETPWAVLLMIIIPCAVIAVSSIVDIIKVKKTPESELEEAEQASSGAAPNNPDPSNPLGGMSEKEKEELKKQMIEEMLNKKGDNK